jgi:hypothetical protein
LLEATLAMFGLEGAELPGALEGLPLEERGSALNGGFVIADRGRTLAEPACCADLGDLVEFRDALGFEGDEWRTLWTGRSGVLVEARRGGLQLRIGGDEYDVLPGHLAAAIDGAWRELDGLEARLAAVAGEMVPRELAGPLARCLVGRPLGAVD